MCVLGVFGLSACDDIDDFTTSPNNLLTSAARSGSSGGRAATIAPTAPSFWRKRLPARFRFRSATTKTSRTRNVAFAMRSK